jgi:hypothetical protein
VRIVVVSFAIAACAHPAPSPAPRAPIPAPTAVVESPAPPESPPTPPAVIEGPGRALTANELALARPIFRDSIDYTRVRVLDAKYTFFQPDNTYMTPDGFIYAPGRLWRDDFASPTSDIYMEAVFLHEMTHVWQYQSGKDLVAEGVATFATNLGAYERAYAYELDAARDLLDYGMEQQASIVEDWFLIGKQYPPRRLVDRSAASRYPDVLHAFLANPLYARERTTDDVARTHVAAAATQSPELSVDPTATDGAQHLCDWRFSEARTKRH